MSNLGEFAPDEPVEVRPGEFKTFRELTQVDKVRMAMLLLQRAHEQIVREGLSEREEIEMHQALAELVEFARATRDSSLRQRFSDALRVLQRTDHELRLEGRLTLEALTPGDRAEARRAVKELNKVLNALELARDAVSS